MTEDVIFYLFYLKIFSNTDAYALLVKYQEEVQMLLNILSNCSLNAWMPWDLITSRLISSYKPHCVAFFTYFYHMLIDPSKIIMIFYYNK